MLLTGLSVTLISRVMGANTIPICSSTGVDLTDKEYVSLGSITRKDPVFSVGIDTSGLPLLEKTITLDGSWEAVEKSSCPETIYFEAVSNGRLGDIGETSALS